MHQRFYNNLKFNTMKNMQLLMKADRAFTKSTLVYQILGEFSKELPDNIKSELETKIDNYKREYDKYTKAIVKDLQG